MIGTGRVTRWPPEDDSITKVMAQAVSFSDTNPVIGTVSGNVLVTAVNVSGFFSSDTSGLTCQIE